MTNRHEETNKVLKEINTKQTQFKIIKDQNDEPDLESAQKFVGGMVQGVEFPNGDYLIMNEEGKLMQLPLNPEATTLWRATFTKDKYFSLLSTDIVLFFISLLGKSSGFKISSPSGSNLYGKFIGFSPLR